MEVAPGIHRIEAPLADRIVCAYVVRGASRTILVDTGIAQTPAESIVPALAEIGLEPGDVDLVVVSHADIDHSGGNGAFQALAPRATYLAHAADCALIENVELLLSDRYGEQAASDGIDDPEAAKDWVRASATDIPIDVKLSGEGAVSVGPDDELAILHTPGHSLGHLTLWRERDRVAIIADAVLSDALVTVDGAPAFPPTYRYLPAYRETIDRIRALRPAVLLTSHFPVMNGDEVGEFLDRSQRFVERLDDALASALAAESRTLRDLIDELSPQVGTWPEATRDAMRFPLTGHLEELVAAGSIREETDGPVRRFARSHP